MRPSVSIIVPFYGNDSHRVAAWQWLRERYTRLMPDAEIVIARSYGEPFCKGAALTWGAMHANGDIFIIADADSIVLHSALQSALELIRGGVPWVVPHRFVYRLTEAASARILATDADALPLVWDDAELIRKPYQGYAGGGVLVISRENWVKSGGIPHEFVGWGGEDEALALILDAIAGPHVRLEAPLYHLWHEPGQRTASESSKRNRTFIGKYAAVAGDGATMRRVVNGEIISPHEPVRMRAVQDFRRGSHGIVTKGTEFWAKPHEAEQHARLRHRYAERISA